MGSIGLQQGKLDPALTAKPSNAACYTAFMGGVGLQQGKLDQARPNKPANAFIGYIGLQQGKPNQTQPAKPAIAGGYTVFMGYTVGWFKFQLFLF